MSLSQSKKDQIRKSDQFSLTYFSSDSHDLPTSTDDAVAKFEQSYSLAGTARVLDTIHGLALGNQLIFSELSDNQRAELSSNLSELKHLLYMLKRYKK